MHLLVEHKMRGAFWLCLIAILFVLAHSLANPDREMDRVTIAIGGPVLLIAVAWSAIGIGQFSRRQFKEGERSLGVVLAWLTVLLSAVLIILGLFVVDMIDRNLGSRYGRIHPGPIGVETGCVFRLAFVIGSLLLFVAAGNYVSGIGQLSLRRFKEGQHSLGVFLVGLTAFAGGGLILLGCVIITSIGFALFHRQ